MERIITEMRRQAVSAEMLEPLAESDQHVMRDKIHDIHLIYETFESLFTGVYVNAEESIKLLAELVDQSTIARGAIVYIDGFHDFSKQEQIVVHKLFNVASSVKMSLTLPEVPRSGESPNELNRFFLPAKTYSELTQILQAENLSWGVRQFAGGGRFENAGISMLEQFDDQPRGTKQHVGDGSIQIVEAVNRRVEVESVARAIRDLVRKNGYRYEEIAILMRDIEPYEDLLKHTFARFDIPYFLDDSRSMMHHPVIEFIRSTFEMMIQNYRYEPVFRAFKTDLLFPLHSNWQMFRERVDELENYVLATGKRSRIGQSQQIGHTQAPVIS
ncbi:3'-5' exonuclease [Geomicrobium sp. JCM 19037]|uniref:3'-5' exonuclease n=1 Tax=Geomicrobium sp. JCM 19037 TaxID=1460634 RepID=UPI00187C827A|nr:3'-5' exonuclease [Geomicrobium sp. JCM 19037]